MRFTQTPLAGGYVIDVDEQGDERGFFARLWCEREMQLRGINIRIAQANMSYNRLRGTLRGLHLQRPPHAECKLVRCVRGAIFDVMVDLRPESPGYLQWFGTELSAGNRRALFIPEGFAHGYQTLTDASEVFYQVSTFHTPQAEGGLRWDDPLIGIDWPLPVAAISDKDRAWPYLHPMRAEGAA